MGPGDSRRQAATAALLLAAGFVAMSVRVEVAGSFPGDESVLTWLHETIGTSWDDAMVAIGAATRSWVIAVVATGFCTRLVAGGRRRDALILGVTVALALVLNPLLKVLFERPRPTVRPSPESVSQFAYPSGHASATAALVGAGVLVADPGWRRRVAIAGAVGLVIASGSRLVIGVHYPSDILAGWLWVGAWVTAMAAGTSRRASSPT